MSDSETGPAVSPQFQTTRWSLVLKACQSDTTTAATALNKLCQMYWYPVYAFIRRNGHGPEDCRDLTQDFFASLLQRDFFMTADPERGRLRSFLLVSAKNFLGHQREKARALKRGGEYSFVSLDSAEAEGNYAHEPANPLTPDQLYQRRWALTVLEQTLSRLKDEYVRAGKTNLFESLQSSLYGDKGDGSYAEIGARLNMSEGAARIAAHRLRSRYAELLRAQVAETVASRAEVEEELATLRAALVI
jgi:RNA polymerase sigma-70 factor (ECF subfamily)